MSVLSALANQFQNLTTDASPDPPRIIIEGRGPNPDPPPELKPKSAPVTPEPDKSNVIPDVDHSKASQPETTIPKPDSSKGEPRPKSHKTKTKQKFKPAGGNVISINIAHSNGVKIAPKTVHNYNMNQYNRTVNVTPESTIPKPKAKPMTEDVKELSFSQEEITIEDILVIKKHMGRGWRDVARKLCFSEGQIDQFAENDRDKVDEIIYQILLDWKQANTKDAQLGDLIRIMWSCGEYDCVHHLLNARHKPADFKV